MSTTNPESCARLLKRLEDSFYLVLCEDQIVEALYDWFDHAVIVDKVEINTWLLHGRRDGIISLDEYQRGLRTDIIARDDGFGTTVGDLAVVETTAVVNPYDLYNAAASAAIIRRVNDAKTDAFVATYHPWHDDIDKLAHRLSVNLLQFQPGEFAMT